MKQKFTLKLIIGVFLLITTTITAQFQWAKKIGDGTYDKGKRMVTESNGNVITGGEYSGPIDFDPGAGTFTLTGGGCFVQKMDASGIFMWAKSFGGYSIDGISKDASGNILLCGFFYGVADFDPGPSTYTLNSGGPSTAQVYALKLDPNGNFLWAVNFGGNQATANDISNDPSGNVFITGQFLGVKDFDPGVGVFNMGTINITSGYILKLDASGNFVWAKEMANISLGTSAAGRALEADGLGNIIATGSFNGVADFDPGVATYTLSAPSNLFDIFIQKLDASGNFVWAMALGTPTVSDFPYAICVDASNNIYSCGLFSNSVDFDPGIGITTLSATGQDGYVWKLDAGGNFVWAKNFGDKASSLSLDASGNVYTIGNTTTISDLDPGAGTYTVSALSGFIQKLDASGNFGWARGYFLMTEFNDISVNGSDVYFTGRYNGSIDFDPDAPVYNLNASLYACVIGKLSSYPVSVNENSITDIKFNVFPNPSNGKVTFLLDNQYTGDINLYDYTGKLVYSELIKNESKVQMDLSKCENGIYFVRTNTSSAKIIIEN